MVVALGRPGPEGDEVISMRRRERRRRRDSVQHQRPVRDGTMHGLGTRDQVGATMVATGGRHPLSMAVGGDGGGRQPSPASSRIQ